MILNAVIVADQAQVRDDLLQLLRTHCPEVVVKALAPWGEIAHSMIETFSPHLVFVTVRKKGEDGLRLRQTFPASPFSLIFVQDDESHALQAVKVRAADYLLRPIDKEELQAAIFKVIQDFQNALPPALSPSSQLPAHPAPVSSSLRITVPDAQGFSLINRNDIIRVEAMNNYACMFFRQTSLMIPRTLKHVEQLIDHELFARIHRSHLINLSYLISYQKGQPNIAMLQDGTELPISRRHLKTFLAQLQRQNFG